MLAGMSWDGPGFDCNGDPMMTDEERSTDAPPAGGWREAIAVLVIGAACAVVLTYPFASQMAHVGRAENSDGQFSIWNVAWVARTIIVDPGHLFDSNIFYPHRQTLAFSEDNLGAGILAIPAYWATGNPYFSLNVVFLLALTLSVAGAYYLSRYLTGDRRAAMVSAIAFGFCPYIFGHTSHIQLLMTAGFPFSMLAFHRLADRPTGRRATTLGLVVAAQAAFCGYYAIYTVLMLGLGMVTIAVTRQRWANPRYWAAMALAAAVAVAGMLPLFAPYHQLQRTTGFTRPLSEAVQFSADWRAYLASSAVAHRWMLRFIGHWNEVLFPGFIATTAGAAGLLIGWKTRGRSREIAILYGALAALACWASFGPQAGLYGALYRVFPIFAWMRAPARFGILVALALSVLSSVAIREWLARTSHPTLVAGIVAIVACAELATPLHFRDVPPIPPAYRLLASLPVGPVLELPFLSRRPDLHGHAKYMLYSTTHWMPLINGYSDYIPQDFVDRAQILRDFPSRDAFRALDDLKPRYAVLHVALYGDRALLRARLAEFADCLKPLYTEDETQLYEILECRDVNRPQTVPLSHNAVGDFGRESAGVYDFVQGGGAPTADYR
jgi:hypothetical protein